MYFDKNVVAEKNYTFLIKNVWNTLQVVNITKIDYF